MAAFEVIALDTATPQLRAPGASDTYTFPRAVEMPLGTANGVLYLNGSKVVTSGSGLTFDGTNLGVGTASPTLLFQVGSRGGMDSTGIFRWGSALTGNNRGVLSWDTNIASIGAPQNLVFCANSETTERMRINASGNLGLGVTPSSWTGSGGNNIEIGAAGNAIFGNANLTVYSFNANFDSLWKYSRTGFASRYEQQDGVHRWFTAPSGTAGNPISFTQAMTLDASGNLGIGTSSPGAKLDVNGNINVISSARIGYLAQTDTGTVAGVTIPSYGIGWGAFTGLGGTGIGMFGYYGVILGTNNTERLRLKNAGQLRFVPLAADPGGAENGDVYYNSTTNKLRLYAAGAWVDLN